MFIPVKVLWAKRSEGTLAYADLPGIFAVVSKIIRPPCYILRLLFIRRICLIELQ